MHLGELGVPYLLADYDDPDLSIVCAAESFCELTEYSMSEVLGRNCRFLQGPGTEGSEV